MYNKVYKLSGCGTKPRHTRLNGAVGRCGEWQHAMWEECKRGGV